MRGNPLIRLAIVLALFLIALVPMWKLTAAREPAPTANLTTNSLTTVPTQLEVTGSPSAEHFTVRHLGKIIWEGHGGNSTQTLSLPGNAFDLQVQATWSAQEGKENALRVRVSRDDLPLADATFWGQNQIDEVLSVPAN